MSHFQDRLKEIKNKIHEVGVDEVQTRLEAKDDVVLIDVRQRDEIAQGSIAGSIPIPRGLLEIELPKAVENKDQELIIYCAGGTRSALAANAVHAMGYQRVSSMAGGFGRWKQIGGLFRIPTLEDLPQEPEEGTQAQRFESIDIHQLEVALASENPPVLIDIREDEETASGYIEQAVLSPRGFFEMRVGDAADLDQEVVIVSSRGARATYAAQDIHAMGYAKVKVLAGGHSAWKDAGLSIFVPRRLSTQDKLRYSRHLIIPEIGEEGQLRLLQSKVLLMGAGGLGSPAAYYLAAAGVGTLGIIDSDVVDRSNLQRQILHTDAGVGTPKVDSARATLLGLNPDIEIKPYNTRLTSENALEIFEGYDLVVDGGDNFPTRYLVNDACVHLGIPCVHGSVYRFEGQVTSFVPGEGPCYRCLYPEPPPPEFAPSCAEAGVLGVLPGIIGLLQAIEVVKLLVGIGKPLVGRLLHFDGLNTRFRELKLRRDTECPACGDDAEFTGFIDYDHFCGIG
jgi:molybdopterin/thiamine biosynthesis adenylyltransferase/rhodanese-related sulfurtransferase